MPRGCQPGYHSHSNGKGGYTGCHPIADQHEGEGKEALQAAHMQALQRASMQEQFQNAKANDRNAVKPVAITADSRQGKFLTMMGRKDLIDKDYVTTLKRICSDLLKIGPVNKLIPTASCIQAVSKLADLYAQMDDTNSTKEERQGFVEVWSELDSQFDTDNELSGEEVEAIIKKIRKQYMDLLGDEEAKKSGTVAHGQLMAYKQFLSTLNRFSTPDMKGVLDAVATKSKSEEARKLFESCNDEQRKFLKTLVDSVQYKGKSLADVELELTDEERKKFKEVIDRYREFLKTAQEIDSQEELNRQKRELTAMMAGATTDPKKRKVLFDMGSKTKSEVLSARGYRVPKEEMEDLV